MAHSNNKESFYIYKKINDYQRSLIEGIFDEQTDYEIKELEKELRIAKNLRRFFLMKTLLFPLEMVLTLLLFGMKRAGRRWKYQKQMIRLLRSNTKDDTRSVYESRMYVRSENRF